jgi:hypothetical protein
MVTADLLTQPDAADQYVLKRGESLKCGRALAETGWTQWQLHRERTHKKYNDYEPEEKHQQDDQHRDEERGLRKRSHGGNENPTRNRKSGLGNPPPTAGASELYPNHQPAVKT